MNLSLSMGMSNDYKVSLECGSNLIRVGSRIFQLKKLLLFILFPKLFICSGSEMSI